MYCYLLLSLSLLVPPLGLFAGLVGIGINRKNWRIYIFCIALALASFAYSYIPLYNSDLVRYFSFVHSIENLSFYEAMQTSQYGSGNQGLFVFVSMCWLIGKTNDPSLLPAISVYFVYYIGLYITCKTADDLKVSTKQLLTYISFMLLACNFFALVNNVRNVLSFAIISFALFLDIYEKKKNIWVVLLYIIPFFIHQTSIILIIVRLALLITNRIKYILIGLTILIRPIIAFLFSIFNNIDNLLGDIIRAAYYYFFDTTSSWGLEVSQSGSERLLRILYIFIAFVFTVLSFYIAGNKKKVFINEEIVGYETFGYYVFIVGLMTLACAPMLRPEYWRFAVLQILLSGLVYFITTTSNIRKKLFSYGLNLTMLFCVPICALWVRNIYLSAELHTFLVKPFGSTPLYSIPYDLFQLLFG